jgi:hypothetical protein
MQRLLDAAAAADMLAWENSGFSIDASVRITLIDRDVPSYFRSLEHVLRYCARRHFARDRQHRQAGRGRCRWACGQYACHGLLRHSGEAPVARHLAQKHGRN